jgi:hypothetical protein
VIQLSTCWVVRSDVLRAVQKSRRNFQSGELINQELSSRSYNVTQNHVLVRSRMLPCLVKAKYHVQLIIALAADQALIGYTITQWDVEVVRW